MKILINDIIQYSDAPEKLKTPSLADTYDNNSFTINLDSANVCLDPYVPYLFVTEDGLFNIVTEDGLSNIALEGGIYSPIDCIGIGNTDATQITVNGEIIDLDGCYKNGLYLLSDSLTTEELKVSHNGTYLGRFAAGKYRDLCGAPAKEPGFYTTIAKRKTASLNTIDPAGGAGGRRIGFDFRYKIDENIFKDMESAYTSQISKGFPFFMYFDREQHRINWVRMYMDTDNNLLMQGSANRFLYSKRLDFFEAF